ncbi:hypothetical protein PPERSA_01855 [Pseudocohnilembus persalinus]|uniref:Uncharacterized protein n=1 Tax=Pseudocohnilembus persalinus TaxID=266149 RepID=A0A0V0R2N8_PSEPJ|nr:hypothetical protein PPERSA_01855 [Pseudocohnilembus persalinus]|eukprot:KRX08602.1 hypothetical protein PPERSA_01855 [Pseudocohnilembus persalinus]
MMQGPPGGPQGGPMMGPPGGDMFMMINQENFPMFIMQNSELVEEEDRTIFKKQAVGIARNIIFSTCMGVFLNVQVKNIPKINFMKWNKFLRFGVRMPLFFLPFGLFYQDFDNKFSQIEFLRKKYFTRVLRYQKTGDMKHLDPTGQLQQAFQERMM